MAEYIEREKIKTCFAQIIVNNSEDKPYYSIMYWENGAMNIGFSSYNLDYVRRWLNEEFEVKRNVDVTLVKRAHWIEQDGMQICPKCGEEHTWDDFRAAYCDCCGAKMDGDEDDD